MTNPYYHPPSDEPFALAREFVESFRNKPEPFGFNGLGHFVYLRTYSRTKPDGSKERWFETVERVVNGTYNMQKAWVDENHLGWKPKKAQRSAQEMYRRIFDLKFSPPGRGLWAMGSALTTDKKLFAPLNNCAFVSTDTTLEECAKPYVFMMDSSMLGIGVGFDTRGAGRITVVGPSEEAAVVYTIPDSREGWVESVKMLLESYFLGTPPVHYHYSLIRPRGTPMRTFGGIACGPGVLKELHMSLWRLLDKEVGKPLSSTCIVDIMNLIGKCCVSGNVRRSAQISFGDHADREFVVLKDYEKNPHRASYGWSSNNSVFADIGMDYHEVCALTQRNGEPGFAWLENMRTYSRMNGAKDHTDKLAMGGNPCLEQTLESFEMCCLVETFPHRHSSKEDFLRTLKFAYLYAKTVTLGNTHWPETNRVMLRNRRIGCSISGIAQFITDRNIEALREWCNDGYAEIQKYDRIYSNWFAIPRSIKTTSVKPSGTVSLLAGATSGMHYPISRYYLRRVRLDSDSELLRVLQHAGYHTEPVENVSNTHLVEFPIDIGAGIRSSRDVGMWEQLSLAAFLQRVWADNQVSCTVTFDPETEGPHIEHALNYFQYTLKGISFLPRCGNVYKQMPYEEIDCITYETRRAMLQKPQFDSIHTCDAKPELYCDGDSCAL